MVDAVAFCLRRRGLPPGESLLMQILYHCFYFYTTLSYLTSTTVMFWAVTLLLLMTISRIWATCAAVSAPPEVITLQKAEAVGKALGLDQGLDLVFGVDVLEVRGHLGSVLGLFLLGEGGVLEGLADGVQRLVVGFLPVEAGLVEELAAGVVGDADQLRFAVVFARSRGGFRLGQQRVCPQPRRLPPRSAARRSPRPKTRTHRVRRRPGRTPQPSPPRGCPDRCGRTASSDSRPPPGRQPGSRRWRGGCFWRCFS